MSCSKQGQAETQNATDVEEQGIFSDIVGHVDKSILTLFADDTSLVALPQIPEELAAVCKHFITYFANWSKFNNLILNIDETLSLFF